MIEAKELDGELWIKASDHHKEVKVAVEHEREACAKLCDELDQKLWEDMGESMSGYGEAIRERT